MEHGFLAVISFLMGSIVAGSFLGLGYLRDIRMYLKQLNEALDVQNMKLDCIAEWLIDQDQDLDPDYAGIDDPNSTDLLVEMFLTEEDRVSLLEEDSCNE